MNNKHSTERFLPSLACLFRFDETRHRGGRSEAVFCSWLFSLLLLAGCQSSGLTSLHQQSLSGNGQWAVMPFNNHATEMPEEFALQLERILRVQLPSNGIADAIVYQQPTATIAVPGHARDIYNLERTRVWAGNNNIRYTISGDVHEWRYDEENRFSISLVLSVLDIDSGEEAWSIDGMAQGNPNESAYEVSRKLIVDLLAAMPVGNSRTH